MIQMQENYQYCSLETTVTKYLTHELLTLCRWQLDSCGDWGYYHGLKSL